MIKQKKKICKSCDKEAYLWSKGMCKACAYKVKKDEKKEKGIGVQQRQGAQPKPKRTESGEANLFAEIWAERSHKSQISGKPLLPKGHPMWHWQFMHIVPKSVYSRLRLDKRNIVLGTVDEHIIQTARPDKTKDKPEWKAFWETYDRLKEEYHGS